MNLPEKLGGFLPDEKRHALKINEIITYLEENQWQRDNVYAEGFNDGAYQQRTFLKDDPLPKH